MVLAKTLVKERPLLISNGKYIKTVGFYTYSSTTYSSRVYKYYALYNPYVDVGSALWF